MTATPPRAREAGRAAGVRGARRSREFAAAVLAGLARRPSSIPCRFFYDAIGCGLFEEITRLPEYYPTRTETALLEAHAKEIAALVGWAGC